MLARVVDTVAQWEAAGERRRLLEHDIFVMAKEASGGAILYLHGFPTCSFDWRHVLPISGLVALDMLGYGLSDKPLDHRYSLFEQADIVVALMEQLDIERCVLVTHDMGDSVGG